MGGVMRETLESGIPDTAPYKEWLGLVCSMVAAVLSGLGPTQNLVNQVGRAPEQVRDVCSIGHEAARFDVGLLTMQRRQSCAQGQTVDLNPVGVCERLGHDIKCICAALERLDGGCNILRSSNFERSDIEAERVDRCLHLTHLEHA